MPAVIELRNQKVALCEADLTDWSGLFFKAPPAQPADSTVMEAALTPIPDDVGCVIARAPHLSPWRVAILGDNDLELLANNDVILNLNPPPEGGAEAFDWVKPGATSWDWWTDSNNSLSTELTLKLIDFAAEMGWPYHTIDGGWYGYARRPNHGPGIEIFPRKGFDLDRILAHAKEKGVGIWVWCYWSALEENGVEKVFSDFERRGIKGVKIDFMDRQDQWMVRWYEKVVRCAAKHRLMINFHGAFKPTGMNRTWPNQITREGIRGNEMNKFTRNVTPVHCATLPFTRFLLGPADFTPGSFGNKHAAEFVTQGGRGHRYGDENDRRKIWAEEIGTRAHALALCVAFDSPLTTLCDWPERYRSGKGLEALRALPTVWKNTLPLAGKIGRYYSVVRETYDGRLYLATFGVKGASFELPLYFLPEGTEWDATFYTDGPNVANDATDLSVTTQTVTRDSNVKVTVAPEGGAVVIFQNSRKR
jgi:alpha-glucosidase